MKKFLAFDCSGEEIIIGVHNAKEYVEIREVASGTENLLPNIDKLLKKAKLKISDIEVVCVGVGPGSWTGARVGVVTAYGFSEGIKDLKFVQFNSFDLISYNGNEKNKVLKIVKAYANFVYIQKPNGEIVAITKDELLKEYKEYTIVGCTKVTENTLVVPLDLQTVAVNKITQEDFVDIDEIEPMYLRLSQAEYQREQRLKGGK